MARKSPLLISYKLGKGCENSPRERRRKSSLFNYNGVSNGNRGGGSEPGSGINVYFMFPVSCCIYIAFHFQRREKHLLDLISPDSCRRKIMGKGNYFRKGFVQRVESYH